MFHTRNLSKRRRKRQERPGYAKRVLALGITLFALLFPTNGNIQAETLEDTFEENLKWLAENTDYAVPNHRPKVGYATVEEMKKIYYRSAYKEQADVDALFIFPDGIILLPRNPAISFMEKQGYSVHEFVHWLQFTNGAYESYKNWCSDWNNIDAYTVQLKWVKEHSLPKEHIKEIETRLNGSIGKCERWNEIVSGWRQWDLTGVYYCKTEEYAQKIFHRAETGLGMLVGVLVQDVQHLYALLKPPCGIFREGDVGYVTRLIESKFTYRYGIVRLAEVRVRNAADNGRFTRTLFAVSPRDFMPPSPPLFLRQQR